MALVAKKSGRNSQGHKKALEEVTKEDLKRINFLIPESMHTAFKSKVATNGGKMSDYLTECIRKYINE